MVSIVAATSRLTRSSSISRTTGRRLSLERSSMHLVCIRRAWLRREIFAHVIFLVRRPIGAEAPQTGCGLMSVCSGSRYPQRRGNGQVLAVIKIVNGCQKLIGAQLPTLSLHVIANGYIIEPVRAIFSQPRLA